MHFFDPNMRGHIVSQDFLQYFLKLGIAEREKEKRANLLKLRTDAEIRDREGKEKMAAQWAKMEMSLEWTFTEEDRASAIDKMKDAAWKFDPLTPGPGGLLAFQGKDMSPAVFREMLRRTFEMKLTDGTNSFHF